MKFICFIKLSYNVHTRIPYKCNMLKFFIKIYNQLFEKILIIKTVKTVDD